MTAKFGGDVTELPDGLHIRPRPLRANGAGFDSHDDHRLVMAGAVLGLAVPGVRVLGAGTVAKTVPGFREWSLRDRQDSLPARGVLATAAERSGSEVLKQVLHYYIRRRKVW